MTENGTPETRTHGPTHELLTVGANALTYDYRGNMTTISNGQTYAWDMDNMLASATVPTGCEDALAGTHTYAFLRRVGNAVEK